MQILSSRSIVWLMPFTSSPMMLAADADALEHSVAARVHLGNIYVRVKRKQCPTSAVWGNSATGQPVDGQAVEGCEEAEDCLDGQTLTTSGSNQAVKTTEPGFKEKVDCAETYYRFLKNQYMESIEIISRKTKLHFTYAQGHVNFTTLKAIVTIDPTEIEP
ncbi:hypothetical protein HDE_04954 [Halotydeus destructor]|nr:hypothetical protein HDE_04954 [Halotydeus destructor]